MPTSIDSLQIEINANATKANDAINRLCGNIDKLSNSFSRLNTSNLTGLANGVQKLGTSMQSMNNVKTADFTRLANNITRLGNINVSALNSAASSMSHLTRAFNQLGTVSQNAQAVGEMAKNLSKLGGANVQRAITNIPQLATAMNGLMTTLSRSPRVSQNVIQMTNALANLASQGRNVGSATNTLTNSLNRTHTAMRRTSKSSWSLAAAFGKFYANCFLLIRGIKGLWNSIEGTADYIEAFNYFNVAFGKISSEWNKDWEKFGYENAEVYANSFTERMSESLGKLSGIQIDLNKGLLSDTGMKNLGLNIQEITQYASQLASVTNSVGQTGEVSLVASNVFTKLGADISSLFNQDYSGAMKNLQSGLIGQSRALYKYGIDITNATLQTYAYGLGIEKAVSEMTQAEKMQLRMIAILDQSKVAWGDLANTINSPSNMIRQFANNLKETGMVLGQLFIPLLEKVLPIINGVTIAIKRLLVNIAGFLGIKIDFSSFGQGYSEDIDGVTDSFDDATSAANKFKSTTLGIDELNINNPNKDSGSGSAGGSIDLTQEILDATEEYNKVWNEAFAKMESRAQAFADKFSKVFDKLGSYLIKGDFEGVGKYFSESFTDALKKIKWNSVYAGAGKFGRGLAQFLNGLVEPETFKEVGSTVANALNTALAFLQSFGETFEWGEFGISLADGLKSFLENWDAGLTAETLSTFANGILVATKSAIDELGENDTFEDIGQKLVDFICGIDWGGLSWNLTKFFASMANALGEFPADFAKGVAEGILEKIFGQEVKIELPKWLEDGIKYLFVGVTPHIALLSFLPSQEEFNDWFTNDVVPWFSEERWLSLFTNIKNAFALKWAEIQEWWTGTAVYTWWTEGVQPLFALETWALLWDGIKEAFVTKWSEITKWWSETAIGKWWKESVEPWFAKKKWDDLLAQIPTAFSDSFKNAINLVIDLFNRFFDWVNEKLNISWEAFTFMGQTVFEGGSVQLFTIPHIPKLAKGGIVDSGQIFMAGEAGREAIVPLERNTGWIDSISERLNSNSSNASDELIREQNALLREQNELLSSIANKEITATLDTRETLMGLREAESRYGINFQNPVKSW